MFVALIVVLILVGVIKGAYEDRQGKKNNKSTYILVGILGFWNGICEYSKKRKDE